MIRIGTSGFSYNDWKGVFYPKSMERGGMLNFYSQYFDSTEINSTYYAIPQPIVMKKMCDKVPDDFLFTVKANQDITHGRKDNKAAIEGFNRCAEMLDHQKKLGCVLFQFPFSFHKTPENIEYLEKLAKEINFPGVVEFRNREWIDQEIFSTLRKNKLGFVTVDQPGFKILISAEFHKTSDIVYFRFHGRNSARWWNGKGSERYEYLYRDAELDFYRQKISEFGKTNTVFGFFNNHPHGFAVINATNLKSSLGIEVKKDFMGKEQKSLSDF